VQGEQPYEQVQEQAYVQVDQHPCAQEAAVLQVHVVGSSQVVVNVEQPQEGEQGEQEQEPLAVDMQGVVGGL
jgi:hypothetical protein